MKVYLCRKHGLQMNNKKAGFLFLFILIFRGGVA